MEPNKKKKVIDLTVIDQLIQSGVDAIALVEEPAIEINFLAFKKEKFVTPSAGESEGDFIGRCMSAIAGEFPDQDQRLAVCYSYWEGKFQEECPPATTDIALNLENRQNAIDTANYGPLNPNLPNEEYWQKKADMFGDTVEDAKKALCGNCSFFVVSPSIKECIASGIGSEVDPEKTIEAGELGYCEAFDFKCAAKRTCDAWVVGGPITMERESFESYSDYPEAAKNNASRALKYAEENGWGSCGTPVGKIRANQLAKGEPISEDTISRMASFARHKQNSDTPYGEGCGKLMWDAWGGTEGIEWASRKLEEIKKEKLEVVVNAPAYIDQTGESNKKKKKPILETRPVLMSADEELLLAYFSQVGISQNDYNLEFANADLIPWQEGDITPADGAGGRTFYKYVGPPAQRDFCRQMLFLDRLYTFEEIDTATNFSVNPGFGEGGSAFYDIWKYKGGPNCKHRWQKFYAKPDGEIVNKGPATGKAGVPMIDQPNRGYVMSKMFFGEEGDKRILVGPAMVPDMEIPRYDKKTKEIYYVAFSEDAVAKIAEKFMREQSTHNTNQDHDGSKPADTYIFESWIIEDPETDKAKTIYGYEGLPKGTWMVKMRVNSDNVWQRVKNGELKGFSVEGNFVTEEELAEIEAAGLLSKIAEIVQ
jgi:hypothetical protein